MGRHFLFDSAFQSAESSGNYRPIKPGWLRKERSNYAETTHRQLPSLRPSGFRVPASHRSEETRGVKQSKSQNPELTVTAWSGSATTLLRRCAQKDVRDG